MSVFNALYAQHYDTFYVQKDYGQECDLIEDALRRFGAGQAETLLDVGCGTGGHALTLAQRGYAVTGVDLSPHMIELAKTKAADMPQAQRPTFLCGGAEDFDAGQTFDAAAMMFAVVGYLTENDAVLKALRNIRHHLKPGGVFVCDFWYGPSVLTVRPSDRLRVLETPTGKVIRATQTTLDTLNHTADVVFQLWTLEAGVTAGETNELHRQRYFFPQEFALFLSQAGFELASLSAFPSLDARPTDDTWNALAVARAA